MRLSFPLALLMTVIAVEARAEGVFDKVELVANDGQVLDRQAIRGKVVLVVNVASYCGYTPQYYGLQELSKRYEERGLVVIGVPCNQFGGQEPGSDAEIKNFCASNYGITFPLLTKQYVAGPSRSPLYTALVQSEPGGGREVGWNFEKFLVGKNGEVIGRFGSSVHPTDPNIIAAIDLALARSP